MSAVALNTMKNYFYIAATIALTVYGQLVLKWRVSGAGDLPVAFSGKLAYLFRLLFDPFVMSTIISVFLASLCWMMALSKFELSHAYPFMSAAFVMVIFLSALFFNESISWQKLIGLLLIVAGIVVTSRSG